MTGAAGGPSLRWDPDERGVGVADARAHLGTLDALREMADRDGWVAESPETHLLPRLGVAAADGGLLAIVETRTDADGTFDVETRWIGPPDPESWRIRAAAIALIGVVAEATSLIHEHRDADGALVFDVATGMLPDDTDFASHGHTVRLRVGAD